MLNLNLSLLTLTFFIFYSSRTTLSFSNIQWSLFFVALSSFPKADAKVVQVLLPTKFFSNYFSKNFYFFCNYPNYQENIFSSFLLFFWPVFWFYIFNGIFGPIFFFAAPLIFRKNLIFDCYFTLFYLDFYLFYPVYIAFY